MRTKFASITIIGMIVIMAFSVLPVQAAAGAGNTAGVRTESAFREADAFRYLANGWHYEKGSWYYIRGGRTIDGKRYCFRSNGVLDVQKTKKANAGKEKKEDTAAANSTADPPVSKAEKSSKQKKTKGDLVTAYALRFVGNPYVYGGCSLTQGTDCSGFVMLIYRHFGVELPHYDAAIRTKGKSVSSLKEARAGDIICYYGHVAIYLGDGRIVHASNRRDGIKISERADYRTIVSIRRIFE